MFFDFQETPVKKLVTANKNLRTFVRKFKHLADRKIIGKIFEKHLSGMVITAVHAGLPLPDF